MKQSFLWLAVLLVTGGLFAQTDAPKSAKEQRWQGYVVRINASDSSMDVRGGAKNMDQTVRHISYDTATEWTNEGKPAQQSDFKDGAFVIILGSPDSKGVFHATRVDLRKPR